MQWSSLALVLATMACQRRAPGPAECLEFAYRMTGVNDARMLELPGVRERVDELTQDCLTTPFDREFLACATSSNLRLCQRAFARRRLR